MKATEQEAEDEAPIDELVETEPEEEVPTESAPQQQVEPASENEEDAGASDDTAAEPGETVVSRETVVPCLAW